MAKRQELERRGLWLSVLGALLMAALGIGFAILTSSDAVLLDGVFSFVGCAVGFVSLRVAHLIARPDDETFHFGYSAYEPMLNLTKGLLMGVVSLFAFVSSITVAVHGGRAIEAGWATVYAVLAALGCFAIAVVQRVLAASTRSPLLQVDANNWLVDGLFSAAVALAFLIATILEGTKYDRWLPYADPLIVAVLVLISLPVPIMIIRDNWNQLVGKAPHRKIQDRADKVVSAILSDVATVDTNIRMQQWGRLTYLQLYVICEPVMNCDLKELDKYREQIANALAKEFDNLALDVVFTQDTQWVAASIGIEK
ncbi:MAG: cation transporter [Pirellulaceae bacterium]|nr:cation transporter [Pirellulaceae bacterium]